MIRTVLQVTLQEVTYYNYILAHNLAWNTYIHLYTYLSSQVLLDFTCQTKYKNVYNFAKGVVLFLAIDVA